MRDYGKVHSTFWSSKTIANLSDDAKLLALYLMTCSHNTIAGIFRLPDGYITEDIGWDTERVSKGFTELFENCFAERCHETKWVWIRKHLDWNPPDNPNQWKAVCKMAATIPETCKWRASFYSCETVSERLGKPLNNLSVSVPVSVVGGVGETKPTKPAKARKSPTTLPEGFRISDRVLKWAAEHGHAATIELHFEAFVSICKAKGYAYVDWDEAFMNAVRSNWAKIQPKTEATRRLAI